MKLRKCIRDVWAWAVIALLLLGGALIAIVWIFLTIHL